MITLKPCTCADDWNKPFHSATCQAYVWCGGNVNECGDCDGCLAMQWAYDRSQEPQTKDMGDHGNT